MKNQQDLMNKHTSEILDLALKLSPDDDKIEEKVIIIMEYLYNLTRNVINRISDDKKPESYPINCLAYVGNLSEFLYEHIGNCEHCQDITHAH